MDREAMMGRIVAAAEEIAGPGLLTRSRKAPLVCARAALVRAARYRGFTQMEIGAAIGRDHSTVFSLERRMAVALQLPGQYPDYIDTYEQLIRKLR